MQSAAPLSLFKCANLCGLWSPLSASFYCSPVSDLHTGRIRNVIVEPAASVMLNLNKLLKYLIRLLDANEMTRQDRQTRFAGMDAVNWTESPSRSRRKL